MAHPSDLHHPCAPCFVQRPRAYAIVFAWTLLCCHRHVYHAILLPLLQCAIINPSSSFWRDVLSRDHFESSRIASIGGANPCFSQKSSCSNAVAAGRFHALPLRSVFSAQASASDAVVQPSIEHGFLTCLPQGWTCSWRCSSTHPPSTPPQPVLRLLPPNPLPFFFSLTSPSSLFLSVLCC